MDSKKFKRENFIQVQGFAIVDLKLSGNELLCYSLIYGFSQDRESEFAGSLSYIASALNVTKANAKAILDRLINKGLIEKRDILENGVKLCRYQINNTPVTETITPPLLKQYRPVTETIPNNNTNNIFDNIEDNNPPINIPPKKFNFKETLLSLGVAECYINDWLIVRKNKRASNTESALKRFITECNKANISVPEAVQMCAENSWQGFKAEYLNNNNNGIYQSRRQDSRRQGSVSDFANADPSKFHF